MRRLALVGILAVALAAAIVIVSAGHGISAVNHRSLPLEAGAARMAWSWMVPGHIKNATNPVADSAAVQRAAREHWADHCALCHDNDGSGATTIGRRIYPPIPDMRSPAVQSLTDGELFYAIEQGVPWTAMPGWTTGRPEGEQESWALVRFIRHLPQITPEEMKEMEALNPKPPPNPAREKEIEDFLKGPTKKGRGK